MNRLVGIMWQIRNLLGRRKQPNNTSSETESAEQPSQGDQECRSSAKSVNDGWHPEEKKHRRWEKGYWITTGLLSCVITGGAIASAVYAWDAVTASRAAAREAHEQAAQAREQTKIARDSLESTIRPWLLPDVEIQSLEITDQGPVARLVITTTNNGHIPVFTPTVIPRLERWPGYPQVMFPSLANACRDADRQLAVNGRSGGLRLPPQESLVETRSVSIPSINQGNAELAVYGCVAYEFSDKAFDIHETSFMFHLGLADPQNKHRVIAVDLSQRGKPQETSG